MTYDPVQKPKHYNSHPSGIECIEITRHHNFPIGNAIKYLWRQGLKDGEPNERDLRKAIKYIEFELETLERKRNETTPPPPDLTHPPNTVSAKPCDF